MTNKPNQEWVVWLFLAALVVILGLAIWGGG